MADFRNNRLPLNKSVRRFVQAGNVFSAIITDIMNDRVSVRLAGNGQLMRNLPIVGGPVALGDDVFVDFSSTPPTVSAKGKSYVSETSLDTVIQRLVSTTRAENAVQPDSEYAKFNVSVGHGSDIDEDWLYRHLPLPTEDGDIAIAQDDDDDVHWVITTFTNFVDRIRTLLDLVYADITEPIAAAHISDTTDAHDASAISIADAGSHFTATDVEGALQELGAGGGGMVMLSDKLLVATATQFDFTSIPATYKDLVIELYVRSDKAATTFNSIYWEINGDTGTNYDAFTNQAFHSAAQTTTEGFGKAPGGTDQLIAFATAAGSAANYFAHFTITIPNYTQTVGYKILHGRGVAPINNTTGNMRIFDGVGVWKSTSAINRVRLFLASDNFIVGSRATLYGRK